MHRPRLARVLNLDPVGFNSDGRARAIWLGWIRAFLPFSPVASALGFVPLRLAYWPLLLLTMVCYVGLTQVIKMWLIRKAWV